MKTNILTGLRTRAMARTRTVISLTSLVAIAGLAVSAASGELPRTRSIHPDAGQPMVQMPVPGPGNDAANVRPNHPPIDQIPAMPMPELNPGGADSFAGVSTFDAEASVRTDLPVNAPSGLEGDSGGFSYEGALANVDTGFEMDPGFGTMTPAGALDSWPRSGNVKLVMRFVDSNGADRFFVASGSMQDSGVVLTAAHCVYARNPNGINIFDWAREIWVYPAWDGVGSSGNPAADEVIQNFGWARGTFYMAGTAYVNDGNTDRDCGLIRLSHNTRSVGVLTGWFGWTWGFDCAYAQGKTYYNFSYPAEGCGSGLHTGRTMYYWDGGVDACPDNQFQLNTTTGCTTAVWGGMSGSGMYWIDAAANSYRRVHAVCSTSNRSTRGYYCKLWEQFVTDMGVFQTDTRTAVFDAEALRYRFNGAATSFRAGEQLPASTVLMSNATNADPANRTYTIRVYLSSNNNISAADTLLATYNYTIDFAPMQSITLNVPAISLPGSTAAGNYFVGIELDGGTDGNTGNNDTDTWDAQPVTVTPCLTLPAPTGITASDSTSCTAVSLSWSGVVGADSYQIFRSTTNNAATASQIATDTASPFSDVTAAPNTTYYYWLKSVNDCGPSAFSASNSGRRNGSPTIAFQPTDRTVRQFQSTTFVVDPGSGGPFSYQWRRNGMALLNGARISGVDTFRLSIDNIRLSDEAVYDVVITGACGSITSRRAALNVLCTADFDDGSGTGTPDSAVTIDDLFYYIDLFNSGASAADLDDGSGTGSTDGGVTLDDLLFFLDRFNIGC